MKKTSSAKIVSIGVDVGSVNGAIAIITEDLEIVSLTKAPTYQTEIKSKRNKSKLNKETQKYEKDYRKSTWVDFKKVGDIMSPALNKKTKVIYTIERLIPRSEEKESSSFKNGNSFGVFQGLYSLIHPIAYYEPLPIVWKKDLGLTSDKDTSIDLAQDIFQVNLKNYLKKGKVDDIAEALLLAFYGLKQYFIEIGEITNGK